MQEHSAPAYACGCERFEWFSYLIAWAQLHDVDPHSHTGLPHGFGERAHIVRLHLPLCRLETNKRNQKSRQTKEVSSRALQSSGRVRMLSKWRGGTACSVHGHGVVLTQ